MAIRKLAAGVLTLHPNYIPLGRPVLELGHYRPPLLFTEARSYPDAGLMSEPLFVHFSESASAAKCKTQIWNRES